MAKKDKKEEVKKPSVKTKKFPLKREYDGKTIGDSIEVGPKGERDLKSKNII